MTDEQKYSELLKAIGQYLKIKHDEILIQEYEIANLKTTISDMEKAISERKGDTI